MSERSAVTEADRHHYRDHGVVALRGVIDPATVDLLRDAVNRIVGTAAMADMTALGDQLHGEAPTAASDRGRFRSGVDHWRDDAAMREFATRSALPTLVASLLETDELWLYEDSILVKEPATREPTVFHQDHPYFSVDGPSICTTWVPLDAVTRATGALGYVAGSHRDLTEWRPNLFVTRDAATDTSGTDVPDFHTDPGDADILWIDAEPGDVLVHHSRTLHGAGPNTSLTSSRRAVSVRYCGSDTVFRPRALTPKPHHDGLDVGAPIGPPGFPQVLPRPNE